MKKSPTVCLWFNGEAEALVEHYKKVFKDEMRVVTTSRFGEAGFEHHGKKAGTVMLITFEIKGARFSALNGGPHFKLSEAASIVIEADTQQEYDHYWDGLCEGGDAKAQMCGWLKDKFGVSWQVVPAFMEKIMQDSDEAARNRAMQSIFQMKRLDLAAIQKAYGKPL